MARADMFMSDLQCIIIRDVTQPSFYYCTAILLSILFHSISISMYFISNIVLMNIILHVSYIYIYHCFYHIFFQCTFTCMFYVSLSRAIVYMYICIFIYLSIYWKSGTSDLMVLMLFVFANAMELLQSCTKPPIWSKKCTFIIRNVK